ncbi:MAG TPA: isoprenylcysteine carboxylmethyltransferase family protein [Candidatus Eisenbacteria bacterium]|nr:isoprenylcysteine carboxylmethyltransferase family protein [Candidatus Eisenbacteria bacterium]
MFRWLALAIVVVAFGVSGYHRRKAYRSGGKIPRRREGPLLVALRIVFALPLYAILLAYLIEPRWVAWASFALPDGVRWGAVAVAFGLIPVVVWILRSLGTNVSETVLTKVGQRLVTHGPYRWVRHPLYTAGLALLACLSLIAANWLLLGMTAVAGVAIAGAVVPLEERALLAAFGAEYEAYRARTGRFLPRLDVAL